MDADEARNQSLSSFQESVKEVVKQIDEKIPHNLGRHEVKHYIEGANAVSVLGVAFFPERPAHPKRPRRPRFSREMEYHRWEIPKWTEKPPSAKELKLEEEFQEDMKEFDKDLKEFEKGDLKEFEKIRSIISDLKLIEEDSGWGGELVSLIDAVAFEFRKQGYETEVCDEDCCEGESDDSHILVKW